MVSRKKSLTMMLKDSDLHLAEGKPIHATLKVGNTPFTGFSAQALSADEIGIYPNLGAALAQALEKGARFDFSLPAISMEARFRSCPGCATARDVTASA
jgi:hypothetical protein